MCLWWQSLSCILSRSVVSDYSAASWTPGSSVREISQASIWSGLPFPPPRNIPDPGIKPVSPALAGRFFTPELLGSLTTSMSTDSTNRFSLLWQGKSPADLEGKESDEVRYLFPNRASAVAQMVKTLPTTQETWVPSLGWDDSLEKGIATHSSIIVWRVPWTEEPGRLQSIGLQRIRHDWANNTFTFTSHSC